MSFINREELIAEINERRRFNEGEGVRLGYSMEDDPIEVIEDMEDADVEPVRHGYWIEDWKDIGVYNTVLFNECSVCGYSDCDYPGMQPVRKYSYCPHCGAKMDG